ncbi:MAG: Fic family protein [Gemmatimonadota bacterium]|nr:Fic family protein [Gemmatimonadota bacterium]
MDWERFSFEYQLDTQGLLRDLGSIEAYKVSLNLVFPQSKWQRQLDRLNRVRAVHGTTAIEGNPLSEAEVAHQMERLEQQDHDDERKTATKEQLQIRNAGEAQSWVRQRFLPDSPPISLQDLLTMHEMLTRDSDTRNNIPGELRSFSVTVGAEDLGGVHRGAPHERLPRLMEEYIDFINSRQLDKMIFIRALLAHFFLVTIHPFGDGNGRVSRLVEAGILFQLGYNIHGFYGLSNYFYRHGQEYKSILHQCRKSQPFDVTPFVRFGVAGFARELKDINNFMKTKINQLQYRTIIGLALNKRMSARRRVLNQREFSLLDFLLNETVHVDPFSDTLSRRISLSELLETNYVQSAYRNVTRRTFHRELMRLGEFGFIKFTREESVQDWVVELDFGAISKY